MTCSPPVTHTGVVIVLAKGLAGSCSVLNQPEDFVIRRQLKLKCLSSQDTRLLLLVSTTTQTSETCMMRVPEDAVNVWSTSSSPWLTAEAPSHAQGYEALERHCLGGLNTPHRHKPKISLRHPNYGAQTWTDAKCCCVLCELESSPTANYCKMSTPQ